jgi:transcriptional regulator with XRE-family HTH domain
MLTLDEIAVALRDRRMDIVAEATGLHRSTIARIKTGKANPTYDVMKALSDYLMGGVACG